MNVKFPDIKELRSGDLTLFYEEGCVRRICLEETEIIRMIYFALRDENWGTMELRVRDEKFTVEQEQFKISYEAQHFRNSDRIISWNCNIEGNSESVIIFSIQGIFEQPFLRNRAGFCVLHPLYEVLNQPCKITHPDGRTTSGTFPFYISPHQPFMNIRKLEWTTIDGIEACLDFQGDVFEMEDQRNWTDASFKTYCTPLALPFPVQMQAGDVIGQVVKLNIKSIKRAKTMFESREGDGIQLIPEPQRTFLLPEIGSCVPLADIPLKDCMIERIRSSGLDHVRADVLLSDTGWRDRFDYCCNYSTGTSLPIRLALYFSLDPDNEWRQFEDFIRNKTIPIASVSILTLEAPVTPRALIAGLLPKIKVVFPRIPVGIGTPFHFTELNRNRSENWSELDFVVYSISPQVHAFDTTSMVETFEGQGATVEGCRQFLPDLPVHISPVSLFPRFNPDANGGSDKKLQHVNPPDSRQFSLFLAGWTLGCLAAVAKHNTALIDFYEVLGPRGLFTEDSVSPVYLLLTWIHPHDDRTCFHVANNSPYQISCLGLKCSAGRFIVVANHTSQERLIAVEGYRLSVSWVMDESTIQVYLDSEKIQENSVPLNGSRVVLAPYSVAALRIT
jgi:hypothetical protein